MKEFIRKYINMQEIQFLTKQGISVEYTGWKENTGTEYIYEVRYRTVQKTGKLHNCCIFDLVQINNSSYRCQICNKTFSQQDFEVIKKAASVRYCHCGGTEKQMELHIPHPVSGYETHPIFYRCNYCAGKYMYYRFSCETEGCRNKCDISEVYCWSCRQKK